MFQKLIPYVRAHTMALVLLAHTTIPPLFLEHLFQFPLRSRILAKLVHYQNDKLNL